MLKSSFFSFLFSLSSFFSFAQIGLADRYQFNYLGINQAFAGENSSFGIKAITDNQFAGLAGLSKSSQVLVLDGQLYRQTGLAFQGFRVSSGIIVNTGFNLAYSKGFEMGDFKVKVGTGGGVLIQPNFLTQSIGQRSSTHVGGGIFASYKSFFLAASKPVAINSKNYSEGKVTYFNFGYLRNVIDEKYKLNCNILLKNLSQNFFWDLNSKVILRDKLSVGFSFRENLPFQSVKKFAFHPYADYRFSKSTTIGLGYNPTTFVATVQQGANIGPTGSIQVYLKFINSSDDDQSWFGSLL
jgi:Type IX secretion system membrane protein PorP/SprF